MPHTASTPKVMVPRTYRVPPALYEAVKDQAHRAHRSINEQVVYLLTRGVAEENRRLDRRVRLG